MKQIDAKRNSRIAREAYLNWQKTKSLSTAEGVVLIHDITGESYSACSQMMEESHGDVNHALQVFYSYSSHVHRGPRPKGERESVKRYRQIQDRPLFTYTQKERFAGRAAHA